MSAPTTERRGTGVFSSNRAQLPQRTLRTDKWWLPTLWTNLGLSAFIIYATVRAFLKRDYYVPDYHYLTPFYSPCVSTGCIPEASHFGQFLPDVWFLPFAAVSLPVPAGVPGDLLLLPQGLLPVGVAVATGMCCGRTAFDLYRRNADTPDHPEHAPLLLLRGVHHLVDQHLRRHRCVPFAGRLRLRPGQRDSRCQRDPVVGVHAVVPLLPPHHRRAGSSTSPSTRSGTGCGPR